MTIWNKYKKIKEIYSNTNIKTYLTRIEPIIKEIRPEDINDYYIIKQRLEKIKNKYKIYEIIEENGKLYIVIDNNNEVNINIDKLILSKKFDIKKEGIVEGHINPIRKEEIYNLFEMEKSMCKISFETINNNEIEEIKGTGFFCEMDNNFPFKYALFTNNHIVNKDSKIINIEYMNKNKEIKIAGKRRIYTDKELDYTCIEIFNSDNIINFFKIDPLLSKYKMSDIFILQYPNGKDLSFQMEK